MIKLSSICYLEKKVDDPLSVTLVSSAYSTQTSYKKREVFIISAWTYFLFDASNVIWSCDLGMLLAVSSALVSWRRATLER